MKNLEYKKYTGSIEYSPEDGIFYGKVLGIKSLISYEGETGKELEADFKEAIDMYLADCKAEGKTPEKPFKGSFNVRIAASLHKRAALLAAASNTSLNSLVEESIRLRIAQDGI